MKKLLILAMVLSMASAASAALSLGGDINSGFPVGDTAIVTVISDTGDEWMGYIGYNPAQVGVTGCVATSNAGSNAYVTPDPLGYVGYYEIQAAT